jgi:hypothetical protein
VGGRGQGVDSVFAVLCVNGSVAGIQEVTYIWLCSYVQEGLAYKDGLGLDYYLLNHGVWGKDGINH